MATRRKKTLWERAGAMADKYYNLSALLPGGGLHPGDVLWYYADAWYSGYKQGKKEAKKNG